MKNKNVKGYEGLKGIWTPGIEEALTAYGFHDEAIKDVVMAVKTQNELVEALRFLTNQIDLGKLNVRKDFDLLNAHASALKAIAKTEVK